jgi:hypothetical protein
VKRYSDDDFKTSFTHQFISKINYKNELKQAKLPASKKVSPVIIPASNKEYK